MNTAICFIGTGREIYHTFDNLRENVIDPFDNRDVIVYITDTPKAKETEKYFQTLDDVYINVVKEEPLDISKYNFLHNWPPSQERFGLDRARQIYLQMLKSRSYMNNLIDQIDKKYDRVIFSRMDVIYKKPIKESVDKLDLSKLWLPHFHNWTGGFNDRFAVSSRENMYKYFSLYDYIDDYAEMKMYFCAENTLKFHLLNNELDIGIFNIHFSRIRNGELHETFEKLDKQAVLPCDV
tara:strand:+ start:2183 stop:2893 length:711 start_codon:yes stop_codon:yes gene_type:complete